MIALALLLPTLHLAELQDDVASSAHEWEYELPSSFDGLTRLLDIGDVNGDGTNEIVIGCQFGGGAAKSVELRYGSIQCISGGAAAVLWQSSGPLGMQYSYGKVVELIGDVDQDGISDIAAGVVPRPEEAAWQESGLHGQVRILSGRTGGELRLHGNVDSTEGFGAAICGMGDVNADGIPDYAISMVMDNADAKQATTGSVAVFSGKDGKVLGSITAPNGLTGFGRRLFGLGDLDGDGVPDIVIKAGGKYDFDGLLLAYSGASRALIWKTSPALGLIGSDVVLSEVATTTAPQLIVLVLPRDVPRENALVSALWIDGKTGMECRRVALTGEGACAPRYSVFGDATWRILWVGGGLPSDAELVVLTDQTNCIYRLEDAGWIPSGAIAGKEGVEPVLFLATGGRSASLAASRIAIGYLDSNYHWRVGCLDR